MIFLAHTDRQTALCASSLVFRRGREGEGRRGGGEGGREGRGEVERSQCLVPVPQTSSH